MLNLLCKYTRIRISIPKALINKCLKDNTISHQDKIKLGRKSAEIESAINKLIPAKLKVSQDVRSKGNEIQSSIADKNGLEKFVILTNKVTAIHKFGPYAIAQALRTTKNRLMGYSRQLKKEYAEKWQSLH